MYPVVRCMSCNNSLGEFHECFQILKNHKYSKEINKLGAIGEKKLYSQIELNDLIEIDVADIFEYLGIERWCCRKTLLTVTTFDSQLFALPNMK